MEDSCMHGENNNGNGDQINRRNQISERKEQIREMDWIEEERRTQPFWEGLASDNEILQSKLERLARQRKMERKKIKLRRSTTRRKVKQNLKSDLQGRKGRHTNTEELQMKGATSRAKQGSQHNREEEATELWRIGKQLGLVDKNNAKEIIKRLSDMEKRDKIAVAKKQLEEAEKKGVKPVNP
ncbi:hypothetical protein SLA2020_154310 [Shorea laevis]